MIEVEVDVNNLKLFRNENEFGVFMNVKTGCWRREKIGFTMWESEKNVLNL